MSPKLFTAALLWRMNSLDWDEKGVSVDRRILSHLRNADDITLFSNSIAQAEAMLNELGEVGENDRTANQPEEDRVH